MSRRIFFSRLAQVGLGFSLAGSALAQSASTKQQSARQVGSVAELRTLPGRFPNDRADVIGYWVNSAGKGGLRVYWDPHSTATENGRTVFAVSGLEIGRWRSMDIAIGFMGLKASSPGDQLVVKSIRDDTPTRVHIEPRGYVDEGTVTKFDMMFDDYDSDQVNYRIVNCYTKVGRGNGQNGENGVAYIGAKAHGDHSGLWPSVHFGFGDGISPTSTPLKLYYFDTSDTEWRTPMVGAWRPRRSVLKGDYLLASSRLYQAQDSGITGDAKPYHGSGTSSDGAVDWLFVRDYQSSAGAIRPCVLIGERDFMPKFGLPDVRLQIAKSVAVWNGEKILFLDQNSEPAISLHTAHGTGDLTIHSEKTGAKLRLNAEGSFIQNNGFEWLMSPTSVSGGKTAISLEGAELISFNNEVHTRVSLFTGRPYQRFYVESLNGQTTLVHGPGIVLQNEDDRTLEINQVLTFVMDRSGKVARQVL